jgi:hypothetical protein
MGLYRVSSMLVVSSLVLLNVYVQGIDTAPCRDMAGTTACWDGLPVYEVMNDINLPSPFKIDCTSWEMVVDVIHLGIGGLIEWEQACDCMRDQSVQRVVPPPGQSIQTQIDVVECLFHGNLKIIFANEKDVYHHETKMYGIHNCTNTTLNVSEHVSCDRDNSFHDVCLDGEIDRNVFDVIRRSDCNAEIVRNVLFQDGLQGLKGWILYCNERGQEDTLSSSEDE